MVLGISDLRVGIIFSLLLGVLVSFSVLSDEVGQLSICFLEDNMPYSGKELSRGFDHDLGKRLAETLGLQFTPIWVPNNTQIQEIESDYPFRRLARRECRVILSVPGTSDSFEEDGETIVVGKAYYSAAFELISRTKETSPNLRQLRGKNVAIQSQTVAHFALKMLGAKSKTYFSASDAFDGVFRGEADAGLLWGPTAGWIVRESSEEITHSFVKNYEPPTSLRWNIHFVTLLDDTSLREAVDQALVELDSNGELSKLMGRYNLPDRRPYKTTYSLGALNELQFGQ